MTLDIRLKVTADDSGTIWIQRTGPNGRTGRQLSRDQLARLGWQIIGAVQAGARDFREERNSSLDGIRRPAVGVTARFVSLRR